jgi:hypothetical protein
MVVQEGAGQQHARVDKNAPVNRQILIPMVEVNHTLG